MISRGLIMEFFDSYKNTVVAWITNGAATVAWFIYNAINWPVLIIVPICLHIIPPILYYYKRKPFGIEIDYTPTNKSGSGHVPDKVSERKGEALLTNGTGTIFLDISISKHLSSFELRFSSSDDISVVLADIPHGEQEYDADQNVLSCGSVSNYNFSAVLRLECTSPQDIRKEYKLEIIDCQSSDKIKSVDVVYV